MTDEDSSCRNGESNRAPASPLEAVVDVALAAVGGSRGFVVIDAASDPRVLVARGTAGGPAPSPSRSAVRAALAARGPRVWLDVAEGTPFAGVASVHRLRLRAFAAAPIASLGNPRGALVVDWTDRSGPRHRPPTLDLLDRLGVAAAACLARAGTAPPSATAAREAPGEPDSAHDGLVGSSAAFRRALAEADRTASCSLPVLVEGESGTGKEALARRIHDRGPRARAPFVAVNCAAIPEGLIEGELFGTVRGAFTGAFRDRPGMIRAADGGTLFLDEVGDMPATMQAKLLRVLQDRRVRAVGADDDVAVDVRIVAATHRRLAEETGAGRFRPDLYHRLAVLRVRVPPLRERTADLIDLVPALLARLHRRDAVPSCRAAPCALRRLAAHPWPGNVRELIAVLARAAVAGRGRDIRAEHLTFDDPAAPPRDPPETAAAPLEETMIRETLRAANGSIAETARRIGWTRQKLYRRLRVLAIEPSRRASSEPGS